MAKNYLIDMDGVLVRGHQPIPGAPEFIARLTQRGIPFLVLTNNSIYTPRDLHVRLQKAIRLVLAGARFIATNPDVNDPTDTGIVPATGSVAALISAATGVQPYFVGKPNPLAFTTPSRYTALSQTAYLPLVA